MTELIISPAQATNLPMTPARRPAQALVPSARPAAPIVARNHSETLDNADPVRMLLEDKRSAQTRRAYSADLKDFFGEDPAPPLVKAWAAQSTPQIALDLNKYKARLMRDGKAEATINRRLSALRALLKWCERLGWSTTGGRGLVDSEKVQTYRDTRGTDVKGMKRLLAAPDTGTIQGLRDLAMLRLMCENGLRRGEISGLDVCHFDNEQHTVWILGKGRGTQRERIDLSSKATAAIRSYLLEAGHADGALFRNLKTGDGRGITGDGVYKMVKSYEEKLSPHRLRHSCITAALIAGNDITQVQQLSRHKRLETVARYDDRAKDKQKKITDQLSKML